MTIIKRSQGQVLDSKVLVFIATAFLPASHMAINMFFNLNFLIHKSGITTHRAVVTPECLTYCKGPSKRKLLQKPFLLKHVEVGDRAVHN